jgi:hypothetical protein
VIALASSSADSIASNIRCSCHSSLAVILNLGSADFVQHQKLLQQEACDFAGPKALPATAWWGAMDVDDAAAEETPVELSDEQREEFENYQIQIEEIKRQVTEVEAGEAAAATLRVLIEIISVLHQSQSFMQRNADAYTAACVTQCNSANMTLAKHFLTRLACDNNGRHPPRDP